MTTTLITGANRSLGLETTRRLIDAGHTVYDGMRDPARAMRPASSAPTGWAWTSPTPPRSRQP